MGYYNSVKSACLLKFLNRHESIRLCHRECRGSTQKTTRTIHDTEHGFFDQGQKSGFITGGTGSIGRKFVEVLCKEHRPERPIVYSRDELKQDDMRHMFLDDLSGNAAPMRFSIGDAREGNCSRRAMNGD